MAVLTIGDYAIGKAKIGYRAVGVLTPYSDLVNLGDTTIRLNAGAEVFDPSLELGVGGPVQGFQYNAVSGGVEVIASLPQLDAATLALLLPGSVSTVRPTTVTGGGLSTTLAAATVVGATNIRTAAVTPAAVGDFISIDTAGNIEYRQLTFVGTLGAGGTGLSFFEPLAIAHASAVAVVETDGDGRTVVTPPAPGRVSTASFKEFLVIWPRPDASWGGVRIFRGLINVGSSPLELATGPRTMGRVAATITGYRNPADTDAATFELLR